MPGKIVSPDEWRAARIELLKKEKEHTKAGDDLARLRSEMPMTKLTTEYQFVGPSGSIALADLFQGNKQLIIYHHMFDPSWDTACKSCSFVADNMPSYLEHLKSRNTAFVRVSRAPYEKIASFQERMGWTSPWVSSYDTSFNYDFHATVDKTKGAGEYNYRSHEENKAKGLDHVLAGEKEGFSVFVREGDEVYHSYSCYDRGIDHLLTTFQLLDLTPLGRQDTKEGGLGFEYHDSY